MSMLEDNVNNVGGKLRSAGRRITSSIGAEHPCAEGERLGGWDLANEMPPLSECLIERTHPA